MINTPSIPAHTLITNNADFLFLYEAIQCNPNGDPDQENKPRMDYETDTNLVTDARLKRYIRDYLAHKNGDRETPDPGQYIFVDMEDGNKVGMDTKMERVLGRLYNEVQQGSALFDESPDMQQTFDNLVRSKNNAADFAKALVNKKPENAPLNRYLLAQLVKRRFIDIRLFGCAFAIDGFTRPYTGPIQINWGFSLHKVQLMESNVLTSIMNDGSSTFGKDYRVYYSLLAFNGTINKFAAKSTGLTMADMDTFRDAIWNSIPALPTRSKLNQYPKLYVEITYNEGYCNGYFGDLRNYLSVKPTPGLTEKQIRRFDDLTLDLTKLQALLSESTGTGKAIQSAFIRTAPGISLSAQ